MGTVAGLLAANRDPLTHDRSVDRRIELGFRFVTRTVTGLLQAIQAAW
jgi:hypothetical protein